MSARSSRHEYVTKTVPNPVKAKVADLRAGERRVVEVRTAEQANLQSDKKISARDKYASLGSWPIIGNGIVSWVTSQGH